MSGRDTVATAADLMERLFPLCRSITGEPVRETLRALATVAPFDIHEVPSGTRCYDWTVPDEWTIRDAWIADPDGRRLVDFRRSNLHVASYSVAVDAEMSFADLRPRLHTMPAQPDAIPYRTLYHRRDWSFCLSEHQLAAFDPSGHYRVRIDSTLAPGSLTYGERVLPGRSGREYLIWTYCCHPSMANDNLSGCVLWTLLLDRLSRGPTEHGYRFVIAPETIGALAYASRHEEVMRGLSGGLVISCVAGPGPYDVKQSFLGDHQVDRAVQRALAEAGVEARIHPFDVHGSDERQFSSPGFRIPITTISRSKYYEYPQYHTSLDDLSLATPDRLVATLDLYLGTVAILEADIAYRSLQPYGEPMLGPRGLYPQTGGAINQPGAAVEAERLAQRELDAILWNLFLADGSHGLLAIAERTGLPVADLAAAALRLCEHRLLEKAGPA